MAVNTVYKAILEFQVDSASLASAHRAVQAALGRPVQLRTNFDESSRDVRALAAGMQGLTAQARGVQTAAGATTAELAKMNQVIVSGTGFLENMATTAGFAAKRFLAFSVAAGAIVSFTGAVKNSLSEAVAFERQMNRIAQVSGDTGSEIRDIEKEITRLATSMGVSGKEMTEVALVLKQAGLSLRETKTALEAVAQANLAPNFGSQKEVVEGLIAAYRQFNIQAKDFSSILGSMNAVAGEFAVEGADLVEVIRKAGGAAAQTGTSLNELLAIFTSIRSTTRESAETIATGLRTVFTRLQRNETVEMLKELRINLRYTQEESQRLSGNDSLTNQFVGAYEAVRRLSDGLKGLPTTDPRYTQILEQLGGYRQISKVVPMLNQFGEAQRALTVAQTGSISVQMAAEKAQESLAVKMAKTREEWMALGRSIVGSNTFQDLAKDALALASGLVKIVEFAKPLVPILATMATMKLFQGVVPAMRNFGTVFASAPGVQVVPSVVGRPSSRGFARGGLVPGVGEQDSVPANLMPGEFVVRKNAAQAIGYDNLREMNEGRTRFAAGGPTPRPSMTVSYGRPRSSITIPHNSLSTLGGGVGSGRLDEYGSDAMSMDQVMETIRGRDPFNSPSPVRKASSLTKSEHYQKSALATFSPQALQFIHKNAKLLGAGAVGWAFADPAGGVVRLQSGKGEAWARSALPDSDPTVFQHFRPKVAGVLQALDTKKISVNRGTILEKLPFADQVPSSEVSKVVERLRRLMDRQGYEFRDRHAGNIGRVGLDDFIIDPGTLRKFAAGGRVPEGAQVDLSKYRAKFRSRFLDKTYDVAVQKPGAFAKVVVDGKILKTDLATAEHTFDDSKGTLIWDPDNEKHKAYFAGDLLAYKRRGLTPTVSLTAKQISEYGEFLDPETVRRATKQRADARKDFRDTYRPQLRPVPQKEYLNQVAEYKDRYRQMLQKKEHYQNVPVSALAASLRPELRESDYYKYSYQRAMKRYTEIPESAQDYRFLVPNKKSEASPAITLGELDALKQFGVSRISAFLPFKDAKELDVIDQRELLLNRQQARVDLRSRYRPVRYTHKKHEFLTPKPFLERGFPDEQTADKISASNFARLQQKLEDAGVTGIKASSLSSHLFVVDAIADQLGGFGGNTLGLFSGATGVSSNRRGQHTLQTILHELVGHGGDKLLAQTLGTDKTFASEVEGSISNKIAKAALATPLGDKIRKSYPREESHLHEGLAWSVESVLASKLGLSRDGNKTDLPAELVELIEKQYLPQVGSASQTSKVKGTSDPRRDIRRMGSYLSSRQHFATGGFVKRFAAGGFLDGADDKDSVPALVMPGEFILNKDAARSIGSARLHQMNAFGKIPRFAKGGKVPGDKTEVNFGEISASDAAPSIKALEQVIIDAARQQGMSLDKFTKVMISVSDDLTATFRGFAKEIKRSATAGTSAPSVLTPEQQRRLSGDNFKDLVNMAKGSKGTMALSAVLGSDTESIVGLGAVKAARSFDPSKYFKPLEDGQMGPPSPYTAADIGSPELAKHFRNYALTPIKSEMIDEVGKKMSGGMSHRNDIGPLIESYWNAVGDGIEGTPSLEDMGLTYKKGKFFEGGKKIDNKTFARRLRKHGFTEQNIIATSMSGDDGGQIPVPGHYSDPVEQASYNLYQKEKAERVKYAVEDSLAAAKNQRYGAIPFAGPAGPMFGPHPYGGHLPANIAAGVLSDQEMTLPFAQQDPAKPSDIYDFVPGPKMRKAPSVLKPMGESPKAWGVINSMIGAAGVEALRQQQREAKEFADIKAKAEAANARVKEQLAAARPIAASLETRDRLGRNGEERIAARAAAAGPATLDYETWSLTGAERDLRRNDPRIRDSWDNNRPPRRPSPTSIALPGGGGNFEDPLALKAKLLGMIRSGNVGSDFASVLGNAQNILSPAQFAQVEKAYNQIQPGYGVTDHNLTLKRGSLSQVGSNRVGLQEHIASVSAQEQAKVAASLGMVSNRTKDAAMANAYAQQETKVLADLLDAEKRLLAKLYPRVSSAERALIAQENVAKALQGQDQIIRSSTGKMLGTASSVSTATAAGISAPGVGPGFRDYFPATSWVGDKASGAFRGVGRGLGWMQNKLEPINNALSPVTNRLTSWPAMMALPYLTMATEHNAGSAEAAARGGKGVEASFKGWSAAGGAIQGALVGATIGSVVPVVGTAIGTAVGAVIGGVTGWVSGMKDAEKQIRDVKIDQALSQFGDAVARAAANVSSERPADLGFLNRIKDALAKTDRESAEKNVLEATGWFGGVDADKLSGLQAKSARENIGPQLPGIMQILSAEANRMGRQHISAGNGDRLIEQLRAGNSGINGQLITAAARARGVSTFDVEADLRRDIEAGVRRRQTDEANTAGRFSDETSGALWGRLTLNVSAASDAFMRLREQSKVLADAFGDSLNALNVSAHSERLNSLGRNDSGFLAPLSIVRGLGGAAGENMFQAGTAINQVGTVLPGILAAATQRNFAEGHDLTTTVQQDVVRSLGYTMSTVPDAIRSELNVLVRNINQMMDGGQGPGGFMREYRANPTGVVERLLNPRAEAIRSQATPILRDYENVSNTFIQGLVDRSRQTDMIELGDDRRAQLQGQGRRTSLDFWADRNYQSGRVMDFTTLGEMEAPWQYRQNRLAGLGAQSNDPRAIGRELASLRPQIEAAQARRNEIFNNPGADPVQRAAQFQQASQALQDLRDRATTAQQALQNLANVSERNAAAQERLAHLTQERDARRGFGEQWLRADGDERQRILQSGTLASQAVRNGSIDNFIPEQQGQILNFLRSVGNATVNIGGRRGRGNDFANELIDRAGGGVFGLDQGQQQEMRTLQDTISDRFRVADEAMRTFVADMATQRDSLFTGLARQHQQFFTNLIQVLARQYELRDATRHQTQAGERLGYAQRFAGHRNTLARAGITEDAQLQGLISHRSDLEQLTTLQNRQRELDARSRNSGITAANVWDLGGSGVTYNFGGAFSNNSASMSGQGIALLENQLQSRGANAAQARRIREAFLARLNRAAANDEEGAWELRGEHSGFSNDFMARSLNEAFRNEIGHGSDATALNRQVGSLQNRLRQEIPGLNPAAFNGQNIQQIFDAANAFQGQTGNNRITLSNLDRELNGATFHFGRLNAQVAELNRLLGIRPADPNAPAAGPAPGAPGLATGGVVGGSPIGFAGGGRPDPNFFRPMGTDTVPAMLSAGEFVVNAASARANARLLHQINSAGGRPLYRDGGGTIPHQPPFPAQPPVGAQLASSGPSTIEEIFRSAFAAPAAPAPAPQGWEGPRQFPRPAQPPNPNPQIARGPGLPPGAANPADRGGMSTIEQIFRSSFTAPALQPRGPRAGEVLAFNLDLPPRPEVGGGLGEGRAFRPPAIMAPAAPAPQQNDNELARGIIAEGARRRMDGMFAFMDAFGPGGEGHGRRQEWQRRADAAGINWQNRRDEVVAAGNPEAWLANEQRRRAAAAAQGQVRAEAGNRQALGMRADANLGEVGEDGLRRLMFAAQDPLSNSGLLRIRLLAGNNMNARNRAMDDAVQAGEVSLLAQQQALANTRLRRADWGAHVSMQTAGLAHRSRDLATVARRHNDYQTWRQNRFGDRNELMVRSEDPRPVRPRRFATGGVVDGSGHTDNQLALLTPGEGVVTRSGMAQLGVGGLLRLNRGGVVPGNYLAGGGTPVSGAAEAGGNSQNQFATAAVQLSAGLNAFSESATSLREAMNSFAGNATALSDAINKMPRTMTHEHQHQVNVVVNGTDAFERMIPSIKEMVLETTRAEMNRAFKNNMPEAGIQL